MTSTVDATIDALRSGHDELVAVVADLGPDELGGPSSCRDWDLSQVLSHLGSGAEIGLGALSRALDPSAPSVPNTEVWDRWNALSPRERLTGFLTADEALVEAYEALDAPTRETLAIDLGFLPAPVDVATAAGFRLNELALHSWDVRSVFDPAATVAADATPLLFDRVAGLLGWIGKADQVEGDHAVLVETSEPDGRLVLVVGDAVSLGDASDASVEPDTILRLPAEAWLRLTTGRLDPAHTPQATSVEGVLSLDELRRVFPGY